MLEEEDDRGAGGPASSPLPPQPLGGEDSNPCRAADRFKCGQSHDGAPSQGPNDWLAKKFDEMHDMYQGAQHKNSFQVMGYQKGQYIPEPPSSSSSCS